MLGFIFTLSLEKTHTRAVATFRPYLRMLDYSGGLNFFLQLPQLVLTHSDVHIYNSVIRIFCLQILFSNIKLTRHNTTGIKVK